MGCYAVRKDINADVARLVIVKSYVTGKLLPLADDYLQTAGTTEEPGSINLVFNLSGGKLGGAAVDRFPVGTKFHGCACRRTQTGPPSLTAVRDTCMGRCTAHNLVMQ